MPVFGSARMTLSGLCFGAAALMLTATSAFATTSASTVAAPNVSSVPQRFAQYDCNCKIPICRYNSQVNCYDHPSVCYMKKCMGR